MSCRSQQTPPRKVPWDILRPSRAAGRVLINGDARSHPNPTPPPPPSTFPHAHAQRDTRPPEPGYDMAEEEVGLPTTMSFSDAEEAWSSKFFEIDNWRRNSPPMVSAPSHARATAQAHETGANPSHPPRHRRVCSARRPAFGRRVCRSCPHPERSDQLLTSASPALPSLSSTRTCGGSRSRGSTARQYASGSRLSSARS